MRLEAPVITAILDARKVFPDSRALLVGVSGIDAAGKGFVTARLAQALQSHGCKTAVIHVDGWLNLPAVRFATAAPAEHFYRHAIRFEEMFAQLIEPLTQARSIQLVADFTEETATEYRQHTYSFSDIDVVLVEGIFLFQRAYRSRLDVALWVECSFATALARAIERGQEGLPPAETIRAFRTIYFPAQRLHCARDNPRAAADFAIAND